MPEPLTLRANQAPQANPRFSSFASESDRVEDSQLFIHERLGRDADTPVMRLSDIGERIRLATE